MLKLVPDSEMDSDPGMDSDPAWIRIHAIPIPALLNVIPAPDLDPQKSGIITPLLGNVYLRQSQAGPWKILIIMISLKFWTLLARAA